MSEVECVKQEPQFAAFVGIDWADKKHVWCLQAVDSARRESGELEHTRGKKKWVHFRWACPKFLRQSFHEWAGHSIAQSV